MYLRGRRYNSAIFLVIITILFLIFELDQLKLPALEDEEVLDVSTALHVMKCLRSFSLHLNLIKQFEYLPTILYIYHGALQSYFILPFLVCLGVNVFSIRIYEIFVGLLIIFGTYFVRRVQ